MIRAFPGPLGIPVPIAQFIGVFVCGNQLLIELCTDIFYAINGFDALNFNLVNISLDNNLIWFQINISPQEGLNIDRKASALILTSIKSYIFHLLMS